MGRRSACTSCCRAAEDGARVVSGVPLPRRARGIIPAAISMAAKGEVRVGWTLEFGYGYLNPTTPRRVAHGRVPLPASLVPPRSGAYSETDVRVGFLMTEHTPQARAQDRQRRILDAALAVFTRRGYKEASV